MGGSEIPAPGAGMTERGCAGMTELGVALAAEGEVLEEADEDFVGYGVASAS